MSYLDTLRFHFAGRFFSNPSTVNNHPAHWNSADFNRTIHWRRGLGGGPEHGWWNPEGANVFQLETVKVTAAMYEDGSSPASNADGLFRFHVESRGRNPAKMVDLDPDQQLVSMIFGLEIALVDDEGRIALDGSFEPAPFTDIWSKGAGGGGGDEAASVAYQSILRVRSWGDLTSSKFLQRLKQAASDNVLSIKFNLDGYSMNAADAAKFARGRIVGAVATAKASDPKHWIAGRHFGNEVHPLGSAFPGFIPNSGVNYFVGVYDDKRKKIRLDLGNALPVRPAGGPNRNIGGLFLGWRNANGSTTEIGEVPYLAESYEQTAGILELPQGRELTDAETQSVANSPLCLVALRQGQRTVVSEEPRTHIRADMFVARLNPGENVVVRLHASRLGRPLANARINLQHMIPPGPDAEANFPFSGLDMPTSVMTDANGNADVTMSANDPGDPRFVQGGHVGVPAGSRRVLVDGQVYMIGYEIDGEQQPNPSNFLSILVWNTFVPDEPPTWEGSMKKVFVQYGNLYPWMTNFPSGPRLDLADYQQVADAREDIHAVLSLAETHAHYMPITRDLSKSRRAAMLRWLTELGPDGRPRRGTPPGPEVLAAAAAEVAAETAALAGGQEIEHGSKTIAGERRKMVRYRSAPV